MKIGILSTSRIVKDFLPHFPRAGVQVAALCCRAESAQTGRALAEQYGIAALYTDYEQFLREGEFDFVYVATANHLHYQSTKQALLAGRNVICEKPFTVTAAECEELFHLAEERGLWLFEAVTTLHLPHFEFLRSHLADIGPVHSVMANYSQYSSRFDAYLAHRWTTTFDPDCAGGALNDLNVYNLHLVQGLLGAPQGGVYFTTRGYNGVDVDGLAVLQYPGFTAALTACKNGGSVNGLLVQGQNGCLVCTDEPGNLGCCYAVVNKQRMDPPAQEEFRMIYEFRDFARIYAENDRAAYHALAQKTCDVMRTLDTLHASAAQPEGTKHG